ncbi:hypothetical protein GCU56_01715, partial [Geodermatophilus sabuli]
MVPPSTPTSSALAAPLCASSPSPAGLPASFAGFGALLADADERVPADALALTAVISSTEAASAVDLSGIWTLPAEMAAVRSHTVLRALDVEGRLMLPLKIAAAARVPAERDGAVLTVFLPGSTEGPRPNFAVAALPLDARGRLMLTSGVRRAAGIPEGADVYARIDLGFRPRPRSSAHRGRHLRGRGDCCTADGPPRHDVDARVLRRVLHLAADRGRMSRHGPGRPAHQRSGRTRVATAVACSVGVRHDT